MKELELKYGCNPNQKPSKIYMSDGPSDTSRLISRAVSASQVSDKEMKSPKEDIRSAPLALGSCNLHDNAEIYAVQLCMLCKGRTGYRHRRRAAVQDPLRHDHPVFIACIDHIVVSHRTSRLRDILHTAPVGALDIVAKWEECI